MNCLVTAARTVLSRSAACSSRSGAALTSTFRSQSSPSPFFSTSTSPPPQQPSEAELEAMLRRALPGSKDVSVKDTSGGCGTMYEISVSASEFEGLSKVKQHKLVAAALPVKSWHGFVLHTSSSSSAP